MVARAASGVVRRALTTGAIGNLTAVQSAGGFNGRLQVATVRTAGGPAIKAVVKQPWQQALQERWTLRVARELGVERWYADVRLRADGRALVEFVPGGSSFPRLGPAGVREAMETVLRREMSPAAAARVARRDSELVLFVDYLLANSDRRMANVMYRQGQRLTMIDNGFIGMGDIGSKLNRREVRAPRMEMDLLEPHGNWGGPPYGLKLRKATVAHIRERLTPDRLDRLHRILQRTHAPDAPPVPPAFEHNAAVNQALLGWIRSDGFRSNLQARLAQTLRAGELRYAPVTS